MLSWPIWPHVYTLLVVMIGWVFFRAETLPGAIAFLKAMAGLTNAAPTPYSVQWYLTPELWLALVAGAIGVVKGGQQRPGGGDGLGDRT